MEQDLLAIVGGKLIDGTGKPPILNCRVLIKGNRIIDVGQQDNGGLPSHANH
jgi:hypothetical protein